MAEDTNTQNPVGRPSDYTPELADLICARLSGGESLRSICEDETMPSRVTVFAWLRKYEEFLNQYARAKEESADALADDIEDIANKTLKNVYDPSAARVAMDGKKWVASKLKPKRYGDKLDLTSGDKPLGQPILAGIMDENTPKDTTDDIKKAE